MKTVAIIQARLGSTRLPGKILMLLAGKPMLWHIVERVKHSKKVDDVIVATTTHSEDDAVAALCQKEGWQYFRGSSEDVLSRYYQAAEKFGADTVVRLTGDCPFIDPKVIDDCVTSFSEGGHDFISNFENDTSTFARGLDVRVISFAALKEANEKASLPYHREHVWPYVFENPNGNFSIGSEVKAKENYQSQYRLTVDYPEDLAMTQKVYDHFYKEGQLVDVLEVIPFLDAHPEISNLNAGMIQKDFKNA